MTQTEMADRLQIGRRSVNRYEDGSGHPKRGIVMAWALVTAVEPDWLETGRMAHDPPPKGPVTIGYAFTSHGLGIAA